MPELDQAIKDSFSQTICVDAHLHPIVETRLFVSVLLDAHNVADRFHGRELPARPGNPCPAGLSLRDHRFRIAVASDVDAERRLAVAGEDRFVQTCNLTYFWR